jgi:hypothetical protein
MSGGLKTDHEAIANWRIEEGRGVVQDPLKMQRAVPSDTPQILHHQKTSGG